MKRFIAVLLFLVLLPSISFAKTTRGEIVGWWSIFTDTGYILIYVGEDDSAFTVDASGLEKRKVKVDCRTGEWAIVGENTIVFSWSDKSIQKTTYMNDKLYYHIPDSMGMIGMIRQSIVTYSNMDYQLIP